MKLNAVALNILLYFEKAKKDYIFYYYSWVFEICNTRLPYKVRKKKR